MRIGFDARMITHPGIGRYIKNILSSMIRQQGFEGTVAGNSNLCHSESEGRRILTENDRSFASPFDKLKAPLRMTKNLVSQLPPQNFCLFGNKDKMAGFDGAEIVPYDAKIYGVKEALYSDFSNRGLDVLHIPHFNIPWKKGDYKLIVTIHDLIHLKVKGAAKFFKQKFFLTMLSRVVKYADKIIAVSENTKNDIISLFPKSENKIRVIYEAADDEFKIIDKSDSILKLVKERYSLPEKIILFIGTIKYHKNITGLIDAYLKLKAKGLEHTLVIIGKYNEKEYNILKKIHSSDAIFLGEVPAIYLPALYNLARLLVMPSFCEGFGLPALEAMACGTPVAVSNVTSLPEIAGEAGVYFDPYKADDIAQSITKVLSDEQFRQGLIKKGSEQVKRFSWEKAAKETIDVYKEVLSCKF